MPLDARLLLLVNYRPEYQHGWGNKTYYTQLRLDPLPPASADEFLQALLGSDPSLAPLTQLLIACTQGNPFFLEESVRTLVETGVLVGGGERGEVDSEGGDAVAVLLLPARHRSVQLALGETLRSLDAGAPGELLERRGTQELPERRLTAVPSRERAARPDAGRIDGEGPEQPVDVVGDAEGGGARVPLRRRNEPLARRLDDRVRLRIEVERQLPSFAAVASSGFAATVGKAAFAARGGYETVSS